MCDDYQKFNFVPDGDESKAKCRYDKFLEKDPLPDVPSALLSADNIYHYARITSMVWPFESDKELLKKKLKPASYEIDFLGEVHFTNEGKHEVEVIEKGKRFLLKKNSIVFVFLETRMFLPNYIAIRFNLRINLVHKGLLLGTGPLVDPGFSGRLLIPLHNLTSEDYPLYGGDGLIWVEFTKLSQYKIPDCSAFNPVSFPEKKKNIEAKCYFKESSDGIPAVSSIPGEVYKAQKDAEDAFKKVEKINSRISKYALIGVSGFLVSVAALIIGTWGIISSANQSVTNADSTVSFLKSDVAQSLKESQMKIKELEDKITVLEKDVTKPTPSSNSTK